MGIKPGGIKPGAVKPGAIKKGLLAGLKLLAAEFNGRLTERPPNDPTREVEVRVCSDKSRPGHTSFVISHTSGGSEESNYALEEKVSFEVAGDKISGISFSRNLESTDRDGLPLTIDGVALLLAEVREFAAGVFAEEFGL